LDEAIILWPVSNNRWCLGSTENSYNMEAPINSLNSILKETMRGREVRKGAAKNMSRSYYGYTSVLMPLLSAFYDCHRAKSVKMSQYV
jgi:hypothetical protein